MLVMVVFFIAFRWIHLSTPLIRLFLLVLILLLRSEERRVGKERKARRAGRVVGPPSVARGPSSTNATSATATQTATHATFGSPKMSPIDGTKTMGAPTIAARRAALVMGRERVTEPTSSPEPRHPAR